MTEPTEARSWPRTTTVYMTEESHLLLTHLCEQTGLSQSALIRALIQRAAGEDGSETQRVREHVAALAKLVL